MGHNILHMDLGLMPLALNLFRDNKRKSLESLRCMLLVVEMVKILVAGMVLVHHDRVGADAGAPWWFFGRKEELRNPGGDLHS